MIDVDCYLDKFGRAETLRFFKWCITNKEQTRKLFDLKYHMEENEEDDMIRSLELAGLYTASIICQLLRNNYSEVIEIILNTDMEQLNNLEDDYLPVGVSDYLSLINSNSNKYAEEFRVFWVNCINNNSNPRAYRNQTLVQWLENEWYEWEYICHTHCPQPEIIEALYQKISILSINDPSFLAVKAFIQERFYEFIGDEWTLKTYILGDKEIDQIYNNKYVENKDLNKKTNDKYTRK